MKLKDLAEIVKKDVPLHYRNEYSANAVFSTLDGKDLKKRIEFIVEMAPTGHKDIRVNIIDPIDYPLIPLLKTLKEQIRELDKKGCLL